MRAAPKCAYCGRPISKRTTHWNVVVGSTHPPGSKGSDFWRDLYVVAPLRSREDCQRYTNHPVVQVRYSRPGPDESGRRAIHCFRTWDGETYHPNYEYFCTNDCAARMGKLAVSKARGVK